MNTKNILKTLALAMLLVPACNKSEIANDENADKKGFALPVTVNATREGDDATKATYNESTRKLEFSAGDKLFVSGTSGGYDYEFAGTLDYVSGGTFSGTIYIDNEWTGTFEELLEAVKDYEEVTATLLPAGYEDYGFLTIENNDTEEKYDDSVDFNFTYTLATSKATGVEQFSYEESTEYSSGFALMPKSTILNFTITGLAANTNVDVALTGNTSAYNITRTVTTDASGNATFAAGIYNGASLNLFSLIVGGNAITLPTKDAEVGKIYNITRAVTPPTLAQTMTTAGMTVKVNYNHNNDENYCLFSSVGDGTYTFQSGDGYVGGDANCAKALVVEGGKLVFKQNLYDTIDDQWSKYGFSVTFDTSNNSYIQFVGPSAQEYHNPSFISVEVNSVPIALTKIITVADLVKEDGQSWSDIIANNSDKIKEEDYYVVRISDNAKLQRNMWGDVWQDVETHHNYSSMDTYKFEGD